MDSDKAPPTYSGDQPTAVAKGIPFASPSNTNYQAQPTYGGGQVPPNAGFLVSYPGYNDKFMGNMNASLPAQQVDGGAPGEWSSGLCGCFSNVENCCTTLFCPCITVGQNAEIIDRGTTSCATAGALYAVILMLSGCGCIYLCGYRNKLRRQYMLPETPCHDCLVHFFCPLCALCQEYRELKHRGWDMDIGWQGNIELQHQAMTKAPIVEGGMTKY